MTFINWAMLIGLAGLSVPIIIHLLNRRRAQVTRWGAMRFLLEAMASQNRRILIEELLLLVLRCLVVALVVLAMARPFLPSRTNLPWPLILPPALIGMVLVTLAAGMWSYRRARWWLGGIGLTLLLIAAGLAISEQWLQNRRWASGGGNKDIVLLLDASSSMEMQIGGKTNFDRAVEEARAVVDAAGPGDAIALWLAGQGPRPVVANPTTDHEKIRTALDSLAARPAGAMAVNEALHAAVGSLARGANPGKRIVLLTDAQRLGWDLDDQARWDFLLSRAGGLTTPPELICRPLDVPASYSNLSLADLAPGREVVGTDRPVDIVVRLSNTGTGAMTPRAVQLRIDDGEAISRTTGQIQPGAESVLRFEHHFDRPGRYVVQAEVICDDELSGDNRGWMTLDVVETLGALIIDGAPSPYRHDSPADFVAMALAPEAGQDVGLADRLIKPTLVAAADVDRVEDLDNYAVVILANVPRLPEDFAARLGRFVQRGGGLWIAPGDRALLNPDARTDKAVTFYNRWRSDDGVRISPARLTGRQLRPDTPARLDLAGFDHPVLAKLADTRQLDADRVLIEAFWKLQPDPGDPTVRVVGQLDSDQPFLVQRDLGRGRVLLTAVCPDRIDSNLPSLHSFVVLAHEIVYFLAAGSVADGNVEPGGEYTIDLTRRRGSATGVGLTGTYFQDRRFKKPVVKRVDPGLNFEWGDGAPAGGVGTDNFSIRWTGKLKPLVTGKHKLYLWADDGIRLWIDGKQRLNRPEYNIDETVVEVDLTAGQKVDVRLDFFEEGGAAGIRLSWSGPGLDKQVIPARCLFPETGDNFEAIAAAAEGLESLTVLGPDDQQLQARLDRTGQAVRLHFPDTVWPGVYRVQLPEALASLLPASSGQSPSLPFAVQATAEEGRIQPIRPEQIEPLAERMQAREMQLLWARSTGEMTASITGTVPGDEVWQWLALAALATLLAETALARWIAVKRRTASADEVRIGNRAIDVDAFRDSLRDGLETGPGEESTPSRQPAEVSG